MNTFMNLVEGRGGEGIEWEMKYVVQVNRRMKTSSLSTHLDGINGGTCVTWTNAVRVRMPFTYRIHNGHMKLKYSERL